MSPSLLLCAVLFQALTLDDVLTALADGEPLPPVVSTDLGREAAERITPSTDLEDLEQLAGLARAGQAWAPLARALLPVVAGDEGTSNRALELLGEVPAQALPPTAPPAVIERLVSVSVHDEPGALVAARLLGRWAPPDVAGALLETWAADGDERAGVLVGQLAANRRGEPCEWIAVIAALPAVDVPWGEPLAQLARELGRRSLPAADAVLEAVEAGDHGPGAALLRAVGCVPLDDPARWERAREVVAAHLAPHVDPDEPLGPELAAAVRAATDLLLDDLPPLLPALARDPRPAVRVAAVQALLPLGRRDAPTIGLLIELLDDPDGVVAAAAFRVLSKKSGERFPARKALWERWRDRADLPTPGADADLGEWLDELRRAEGLRRRAKRTN